MKEYLAFVDEIGRNVNGGYIYRFDFTIDTDTVWGDFFNVAPSAIVPNLEPDKNSLSSSAKAIFPREMAIAKKSYCFSMQDCIDGIMPLLFCEIDDDTIEYQDKPLFFRFGEEIETISEILSSIGVEMFDHEVIEKGDDTEINNLIGSMEGNDGDEEEDENF